MKLILHVGMPKSGSTAIQHGLARMRDRLREAGYLYPRGVVTASNQSFLIAAAVPPERLPRLFKHGYRGKRARIADDLAAWLALIRAEISRMRPKALILSAETLFKLSRLEQFGTLAALLGELSDDIEIIAYVRKPSDFYLSAAQQAMKASHRVRPIKPITYRKPLEGFAAIGRRLHVFKYDRAAFPRGDILQHFMEVCCPGLALDDLPVLAANVSLSAEGLALLADYRRLHHPNKKNKFTKDTNRLLRALQVAERASPPSPPRLFPDLARTIDQGSEDLLWLRERHGIVFDGIDYGSIGPMPPQALPTVVEEICAVDAQRKLHLALQVIREMAGAPMAAGADRGDRAAAAG